ncbi:hypothetical protein ACQPYH_22875 [Kribbella sp. CA-245084]|uniref:hypothetical protein n=1 Tax=Kribbella sp. CA-245084 TaxID=3239940 RepID=UPI003D8F0AE6
MVKQQLPYPYNQDLAAVLKHLDRRTPFSRTRLANDPVTAAYIAAGMQLIRKHLGPGSAKLLTDPEDPNTVGRPVLGFLSQRSVAAEVENNADPFPRVGSTSTMRSRWRSQSDYIADLLSFALWYVNESADTTDQIANAAERLIQGPEFIDAAHRLSYEELGRVLRSPQFRLELLTTAASDGDEIVREALAANLKQAVAPFIELYPEVFRARGLRLRAGLSFEDFGEMLASLVTGYAFRGIADPTAGNVDEETKRSAFGTAVLAMFLGCTERASEPDNRTIEELVDQLVYGASDSVAQTSAH